MPRPAKKIHLLTDQTGQVKTAVFWCPGCEQWHPYSINRSERPCWSFNGDEERPTFKPSLVVWPRDENRKCHLFVTDGKIQFLGDCYHELAGKTVDMIEKEYG